MLLAGLVKTQVAVTRAEGEELRWLLGAVGLPADPIGQLNVQG